MTRLTAQQKRILEIISASGILIDALAERLGTKKNVIKVQVCRIRDALAGTGSTISRGPYYMLKADA